MTGADAGDGDSTGRRSKVVRLIEEYDLDDIGVEMEQLWTADEDRRSLRSLATYFNKELLATAMADAGMQPFDDEVETAYEHLTGDDVSNAEQTRLRRRLEREGVDVEGLLTDFVTYQAIRSYLKGDRNAEYERDDRDRTVVAAEHIQRLRGRTESVTESKLEQLRQSEELVLGETQLFVDINVLCNDCGQQFTVDELLDRGGCECSGNGAE